ncbi:senecionine N-oxygenase-like [Schistocerca piceifrons]|uniref:senecionine N-oxygenase-like n=1 Tax=Schistocerca piceifrons TaxID=274613 RepID=UPI001F5F5327|nr:senecionine N-oxygenase-like [Schistocerca piceifrons]
MKMQVAVIGAGASGLAAARHLLESPRGHSVTVFERGDQLGGTWVFTEKTGLDVDGRPVHSSMYRSLETNLPKEVMAFPDYPFPEGEQSYLPAGDVLKYLNAYADHFGLRHCIKFRQHVERVQPRGSVWEVSTTNVDTAEVTIYQFDSVMVCSGHYWKEKRPQLRGSREFRGRQSHAHNYRRPDAYRGRRVLLIGSGPSGMDLALEVASVAQQVILSHHLDKSIGHLFPSNVIEKPDVTSITETGANFRDGTFCEVDDICYCTGYSYSFPFLTPDCGVQVEADEVHPLLMHVVSVERPTLAFIGLPFIVCPFALFDLQSRFFVAVLDGRCSLLDTDALRRDAEAERRRRREEGIRPHYLGQEQVPYLNRLADLAGAQRLPPVVFKLFETVAFRLYEDLANYRRHNFRIVDNETFQEIA